jgi:hypothetical protein
MKCKITLLLLAIVALSSCASGYKKIEPKSLRYVSVAEVNDVKLEYKYNLLDNKYEKKENKKGVKLVAVKITNNSNRDLVFGSDIKLTYENGSEIFLLENEKVFKTLKQSPATYLFYLLLTPLNLYTNNSDGEQTSSTPIGLILGPGIAGGNMIAASSANKKFKTEMLEYDINGTTVKQGETKVGLVGIRTDSFEALKLKIE